ncbi:MAG: hypothetical protein FJX67_15235 [Alphaproteobacteria bacterium]|nr:hypothetical protein [Alphaproteobacteria bacterium]
MPRARRVLSPRLLLAAAAALLVLAGPAVAAELKTSGLKLPRFVSLRSGEVNVRAGPGMRYPVNWVFVHRGMPVEVVAEFEAWRKIRDWQGTEGWVHQSMLSGKRAILVTGRQQPVRRQPAPNAAVVAEAEERAVGKLLRCTGPWCRVEIGGVRGWLARSQFWGVYADEVID